MSRTVPTLVYGDVKAAARELLARRELDLRWALTMDEAMAVSRRAPVELVLTSTPFALPYLDARKQLSKQPPCIVIHDGDADQKTYDEAGAAALVSTGDALISAASELTGLRFRTAVRVPLETVVDVLFKGENHFLYTNDLSLSGVCITGFPAAKYGERARITFDLLNPPLEMEAMVVRTFNRPDNYYAGLCFTDVSDEARTRLGGLLEQERQSMPELRTSDIQPPGDRTIDLLAQMRSSDDQGLSRYLGMLQDPKADLPGWLAAVSQELTASERAALRGEGPKWGRAVLRFRVDLARRLIDTDGPYDSQPALELCVLMAEDGSALVDATEARSAILRGVHALHRKASIRRIGKTGP